METAPYDGSWESLQSMPVPDWFEDGKIGIFIHWGPYSAIGYRVGNRGYAEHVPKMFYRNPKQYYPYLKERWGAYPPEFGYKDIVPEFTAANWDPEAWTKLFKEAGAHYVVLTAEHHDGWANWDSELTPWNAMNKGPRRDLVGELGIALREAGLKYAPSYHRERHSGFFAKEQFAVHSEPHLDIAEEIKRVPEAALLYGPDFSYSKAFVDDYVARWKEIQEKYQPDMLWLDGFPIYTRDGNNVRKGKAKPEVQYFDDQVRGMITDFMNDAAVRGQAVYLNNKGGQPNWPEGIGCLEKDNLKMKVIGPKWQSCTTFGTSYGYLESDSYKRIEAVIHEMIEVVSRNGNFLVNIGPKADGTIPAPQVERLRAMGDWLGINGDAIYGTRYWKESGQANEELAFTTKGKKLYAIKLTRPSAPFVIEGSAGWGADAVRSVELLGSDAAIIWEMTPAGLRITPPSELGTSRYAWSFRIVTDAEQHTPNAMIKDARTALRNSQKVNLDGQVSKTGAAKSPLSGKAKTTDTTPWRIDSGEEWSKAARVIEGLAVAGDQLVVPEGKKGVYRSRLQRFAQKRAALNMTLSASTKWENWDPVGKVAPRTLIDAPIFIVKEPGDYWLLGRNKALRNVKPSEFKPEATTLEGYTVPLETTPFPNLFNAPGGLKQSLGGYHAWQSRDMKNWVHHGPVTPSEARWSTTAEFVDGKAYIYYDFPNDQDPHLYIDDDLTDGEPGEKVGLVFKDPSDGSDCAIIRDLDGKFHLIYENWGPINAKQHSWDSPLAGHAVSDDGKGAFKILPPAVDERTNPTGKFAEYPHPHWSKEDPVNFPGKQIHKSVPGQKIKAGGGPAFARYEIHEPAQDAFGDWAAISIGGQYYLFADYHPAHEKIRIGLFTSPSIDQQFELIGELGSGHPDPDIGFAEGKFYLINQTKQDYTSPGPWVERVEARLGVDTNNDGNPDTWGEWQAIKEEYVGIEGFSKQIQRIPASMDLNGLPAGYGFCFELRIEDTTANQSKPMLDRLTIRFSSEVASGETKREPKSREGSLIVKQEF
jgi:alpha-L-fucosidase